MLRNPKYVGAERRCYLAPLNCCDGKVSREHLTSKAVLDVISEGSFTLSGVPWLGASEERLVGKSAYVGKCLCRTHNSALSPLDLAAARFFSAIKQADLHREGPPIHHVVSGHDIERWLLKTLLALAHTQNLSRDGNRLPPFFHSAVDSVAMLENPLAWRPGTGLLFAQQHGIEVERRDAFGIAPLTLDATGEIVGLEAGMQGFEFKLFAVPTADAELVVRLPEYRPSRLLFKHKAVTNCVELTWRDGRPHASFDLSFVRTREERLAAEAAASTDRPYPLA